MKDQPRHAAPPIPPSEPSRPEAGKDAPASPLPAVTKPKLSKEEQMAQFEEALKEEDWGHQPC